MEPLRFKGKAEGGTGFFGAGKRGESDFRSFASGGANTSVSIGNNACGVITCCGNVTSNRGAFTVALFSFLGFGFAICEVREGGRVNGFPVNTGLLNTGLVCTGLLDSDGAGLSFFCSLGGGFSSTCTSVLILVSGTRTGFGISKRMPTLALTGGISHSLFATRLMTNPSNRMCKTIDANTVIPNEEWGFRNVEFSFSILHSVFRNPRSAFRIPHKA